MTEAVAIEPDSLAAAGCQAFNLLIDGELVDAASTFPVIDPATAEPFAQCPKADESMLDRAVFASRRAFACWSQACLAARLPSATPRRRDRKPTGGFCCTPHM